MFHYVTNFHFTSPAWRGNSEEYLFGDSIELGLDGIYLPLKPIHEIYKQKIQEEKEKFNSLLEELVKEIPESVPHGIRNEVRKRLEWAFNDFAIGFGILKKAIEIVDDASQKYKEKIGETLVSKAEGISVDFSKLFERIISSPIEGNPLRVSSCMWKLLNPNRT